MSTFERIIIGGGASGCVAAYRSAIVEGIPTLLLESGNFAETLADRKASISQAPIEAARVLNLGPIESSVTYLGLTHADGDSASSAKALGSRHHYNYAIWARPEDYAEWDALLRVKRVLHGTVTLNDVAGTMTGVVAIDPGTLANPLVTGDWVRLVNTATGKAVGARVHRSRFEVTVTTTAPTWTITLDGHGEANPADGTYELWVVTEDVRTLATGGGANTYTWNGTTSVVPSDGATEVEMRGFGLTEGMAIYLESDTGGINGDPAHFRVVALADNLITVENPLGLTIPSATGATAMASGWSYACMLDSYRATETDVEFGGDGQHGASGLHFIARLGGEGRGAVGDGDTRPNVVTSRIHPIHQAMADSILDSTTATGPAHVQDAVWADDHNSWKVADGAFNPGIATADELIDISKCPMDSIAWDSENNPVALAEQTHLKTWHDKHGYRQDGRETFIEEAINHANADKLTISDRSVVKRILWDTSGPEPVATGVEYYKITNEGIELKQAFIEADITAFPPRTPGILLCSGKTATPAIALYSQVGSAARMAAAGLSPLVDLQGVGANIVEHNAASMVFLPDYSQPLPAPIFSNLDFVGRYTSSFCRGGANEIDRYKFGVGVSDAGGGPKLYHADYDVQGALFDVTGLTNGWAVDGLNDKLAVSAGQSVIIWAGFHYKPRDVGEGIFLTAADPLERNSQPLIKGSPFKDADAKTDLALQEALDYWRARAGDLGQPFVGFVQNFGPGPVPGLVFDDTQPIDPATGLPTTAVLPVGDTSYVWGGPFGRTGWQHLVYTLGSHAMGTMRMGADDDPWAVCDERGRLRGVQRVRVLDLSLNPTPVRANNYTTTVAQAWRIMDMVVDDGGV